MFGVARRIAGIMEESVRNKGQNYKPGRFR